MRHHPCILLMMAAAAMTSAPAPSSAATFGKVVAISGHAADIVLDEARSQLYIANFTSNRIDIMSTVDNTIRSSIPVANQPGSMALSPDGKTLLVANYGNWTTAPPLGANLLTIINLPSGSRQVFSTGDPPLGVAFLNNGLAFVVTTNNFLLVDPISGTIQVLSSVAAAAKALPVPQATFPPQILQTALTATPDGSRIWGIADGGTGSQLLFMYDISSRSPFQTAPNLIAQVWVTSPSLLPRVSVPTDGSWAMIGWSAYEPALCGGGFMIRSRHPDTVGSVNVTGHTIDSKSNTLYAQVPDATTPLGPPYSAASQPMLSVMDADNLTVRDKIYMPENLTGRALLNSAASVMYAISDSGVTVFPFGTLNKANRLSASREDILVQSNLCNRTPLSQTFVISDPGGNRTDFSMSTPQSGITISPQSGTTPATITVTVSPAAIQNTFGTIAVPVQIRSSLAVNAGPTVRLLISNPDQDQRGNVVNVPGQLTDIMSDTARNRIYVLRRDKNQLLIFDGSSQKQIAALRTGTSPSRMTLTSDQKRLVIAEENSQLLHVYNLDSMQAEDRIMLPPSHYGRAVAQSNNAMLVVSEDDSTNKGIIDRVDAGNRCAYALPSLGIWENSIPQTSVLTASPSQQTILLVEPGGFLKVYDAQIDTFVLSRQDVKELSGAFAAADPPTSSDLADSGTYVVGDNVFNAALVPIGKLDTSVGNTMGFAFTGQNQSAYRVTANTASGPGVIQNMPALRAANFRPVRVTEAPLLSSSSVPFTRTVATLPGVGMIAVLSTSGMTILSNNYDAAVAPPVITSLVNAADGSKPVAPGGLISLYGSQMSSTSAATTTIPLPTALGESCLIVNGTLVPLLFVSSNQINAQLPFTVAGNGSMTIHTPAGISNNFQFNIQSAAPSVFMTGVAGPNTGLATLVRSDNNQLVTPTNPLHAKDTVVIYLTGMGQTNPPVDSGMPAPSNPLAEASMQPSVTLGGMALSVSYAGLVPEEIGVYQINATVPFGVPQGLSIPLTISQGGSSTTVNVRVVN